MYEEWIGCLQKSPLFRDIKSGSLPVMLDCLKPKIRKCKQREIIVSYGEQFYGIGIIVEGSVALTKEMYSGNRIIMGILNEGDIFGETVAFRDKRIWPVTVIAQEDSTLLFLPPDRLAGPCSNVCESHNKLIINMLRILSDRSSMLDRKIKYMSASNIRGKISSYLLDMCRQDKRDTFTLPMKRHELADYLSIPRPSLSREMGSMRDEGIIEFEGSVITIRDLLALEKATL